MGVVLRNLWKNDEKARSHSLMQEAYLQPLVITPSQWLTCLSRHLPCLLYKDFKTRGFPSSGSFWFSFTSLGLFLVRATKQKYLRRIASDSIHIRLSIHMAGCSPFEMRGSMPEATKRWPESTTRRKNQILHHLPKTD